MTKNRKQAMDEIDQLSFALTDTALFLDTHPLDMNALTFYHQILQRKRSAVNVYTALFGPLDNQSVTSKNEWTWINDPWPWEGDYN